MAGWTPQQRDRFEVAFYEFLRSCTINSKDYGPICLGDHIYEGQRRAITQILDALEEDIHKIYILKSRQLGMSSIIRALSIFYLGVHKGLLGSLVFDTAPHAQQARRELVAMIKDLPAKLKFPAIKGTGEGNREGIFLDNASSMLFQSAGVKKSKSSGTLGRSVGLTFAHLSELCSYENDEGLAAFEESLSKLHPNRLYIYESTARGYNQWEVMWREACADARHCKTIFVGWWGKDDQRIERDHPDFVVYGTTPPTEKEAEKIRLVRERYGVEITPEQLAWVRWQMDPTATKEGDADPEYEGDPLKIQEQPWLEEEAFQQSGSIFFPAEQLTELTQKYVSHKYKTYMFLPGDEFWQMKVISPAPTTRNIDLKVWEEPDPYDGNYVLGIDPAYGENERNDRSSIQVFRCYADGLDQVAEYAAAFHNPRQLAWVLTSIMGWYGGGNAQVKYALELQGGGTACFQELRGLKQQIETGFFQKEVEERGLKDVFRNVKTFLYSRADAVSGGFNFHLKTTAALKVTWLESFRGYVTSRAIRIRSSDLLAEMKTIARDGDTIKAQGTLKDDRVLAAAFAVHCWEQGPRKQLVAMRVTRDVVAARQQKSVVDQVALFQQNQLQAFFDSKRRARTNERMAMMRDSWRRR